MNKHIPDASDGDLRQQRTRKQLMTALLSWMEERPFREISVVDICRRAMVHRTTFYAHFDGKQDLLRYCITQLQRSLEEACCAKQSFSTPHAFYMAMAEQVLKFMRTHQKLYRTGVAGCNGIDLQLLEELLAGVLEQQLREDGLRSSQLFPQVAAHFYAGAILSLTRWWLDQDMPLPEEALLHHLDCLIPPLDWGTEGVESACE